MSRYDEVYSKLSRISYDIELIMRSRRTLLTKENTERLVKLFLRGTKLAKELDKLMKEGKVWTSSDIDGLRTRAIHISYYPHDYTDYDWKIHNKYLMK